MTLPVRFSTLVVLADVAANTVHGGLSAVYGKHANRTYSEDEHLFVISRMAEHESKEDAARLVAHGLPPRVDGQPSYCFVNLDTVASDIPSWLGFGVVSGIPCVWRQGYERRVINFGFHTTFASSVDGVPPATLASCLFGADSLCSDANLDGVALASLPFYRDIEADPQRRTRGFDIGHPSVDFSVLAVARQDDGELLRAMITFPPVDRTEDFKNLGTFVGALEVALETCGFFLGLQTQTHGH